MMLNVFRTVVLIGAMFICFLTQMELMYRFYTCFVVVTVVFTS